MAIVRLDKVKASYNGNLESVKHSADMTNGLFFHLGNLVAGESELREVKAPTASTLEVDPVVLHATPEVDSDPRKAGLKHFSVKAGKAGRAYHLEVGDIVTVTSDLFTVAPTLNQFAVIDDAGSLKLKPSTDGTLTVGTTVYKPRFVVRVIEQTTLGYDNTTAYAVQVVKA